MTREIHMRLHARQCQRACMKRGVGINLWCWTTVEAILAPLASLSMTLEAALEAFPSLDKTARLVLSLFAEALTAPAIAKSIAKHLAATLATRARLTKARFVTLFASLPLAQSLAKRLSARRTLAAGVEAIPTMEHFRRVVVTLAATLPTVASKVVTIGKRLAVKVKAKPTLNRLWGMTLRAAVAMRPSVIVQFNQRVLADLARRVIAPLRRDKFKP